MNYENFQERIINLNDPRDRIKLQKFLEQAGLLYEEDLEYSMAIVDSDDKIIATGSLAGKVLKCIAVDHKYQGMGFLNKVVTHLIKEEYKQGIENIFLFTKPENTMKFSDLGFYELVKTNDAVLMENQREGLKKYLQDLQKFKRQGKIASSIVVNCNPFTLGHQYLIETAAQESEILFVFVVKEDRSDFPFKVRFKLVVEGTKHIPNVVVLQGGDYIISQATFPSYFLKDYSYQKIVETHAKLDAQLFSQYIAPTLNIRKRYVGEEPFCLVTNTYNQVMKNKLPEFNIKLQVIPRLTKDQRAISASEVRRLIKLGQVEKVKGLVPLTTYQFLFSKEGKEIINKIQKKAIMP